MRRMRQLAVGAALVFGATSVWCAQPSDAAVATRIDRVLSETPLIDAHNDMAAAMCEKFGSKLWSVDLAGVPASPVTALHTDIRRFRQGHVGAQFWSVWIPVTTTRAEAIKATLEQIDIVRLHKQGCIASMIGIEGGHQIGDSIVALRQFYALGARYMTHTTHNTLADSATDNPAHKGLTPFGRAVIAEMNRLGMLVDLSPVSADVMRQAIGLSTAPVIFSHSSACID